MYMHVRECTCVYVCVHGCVHVSTCVYMGVHGCVHVCKCVYMCVSPGTRDREVPPSEKSALTRGYSCPMITSPIAKSAAKRIINKLTDKLILCNRIGDSREDGEAFLNTSVFLRFVRFLSCAKTMMSSGCCGCCACWIPTHPPWFWVFGCSSLPMPCWTPALHPLVSSCDCPTSASALEWNSSFICIYLVAESPFSTDALWATQSDRGGDSHHCCLLVQ